MQIDISNLPPEVESLHKLIATLHEKNNDWAFKYRELSKQNTTLTSQNSSLINEYKNLSTENTDLSRENTSLIDECKKLADDNSELLNRINRLDIFPIKSSNLRI